MVTFNSPFILFVLSFIYCRPKSSISTDTTPTTQLDKSKLKVLTQDPNDTSKTKENDATQYDLMDQDGLLQYKFKDNVKCVEVNYEDNEVWKHNSSNANNPFPESVLFNVKDKTIIFVFKSTISFYKHDNDKWKSVFSGKPEGVELDIKSKKDTDHWSYSKYGTIGTYKAKTGKFFNSVTQSPGGCCGSGCCGSGCCSSNCCTSGCCTSNCCKSGCCGSSCCGNSDQDIWKSKDVSEYATKVIVKGIGSSTKLVAIFFLSGNTKGFYRDGSNKTWEEKTLVESKEKSSDSGIELDVNKKAAGDGFTASRMIERYTYTAIGENGFSKVKHGTNEIWKAENKDGYAKKVIYDGYNHTTMPDLEIYFSDNKKLEYDNKSGTWTKRGDKQPASDAANKTSSGGTTPAVTT